jgi:hypothetical protein
LQTVAVAHSQVVVESARGQTRLDIRVDSTAVPDGCLAKNHTHQVVVPVPVVLGKMQLTDLLPETVDQELQLESAATSSTSVAVAVQVRMVGGITPPDKISHQVPLEMVVSVVAVPAQHCSTTGLGLELVLVNLIPVAVVVVPVATETQTLLVEPVDLVL